MNVQLDKNTYFRRCTVNNKFEIVIICEFRGDFMRKFKSYIIGVVITLLIISSALGFRKNNADIKWIVDL